MAAKRSQGTPMGRPSTLDPEMKALIVERRTGATWTGIAQELNEKGAATAQVGKRQWPAAAASSWETRRRDEDARGAVVGTSRGRPWPDPMRYRQAPEWVLMPGGRPMGPTEIGGHRVPLLPLWKPPVGPIGCRGEVVTKRPRQGRMIPCSLTDCLTLLWPP